MPPPAFNITNGQGRIPNFISEASDAMTSRFNTRVVMYNNTHYVVGIAGRVAPGSRDQAHVYILSFSLLLPTQPATHELLYYFCYYFELYLVDRLYDGSPSLIIPTKSHPAQLPHNLFYLNNIAQKSLLGIVHHK